MCSSCVRTHRFVLFLHLNNGDVFLGYDSGNQGLPGINFRLNVLPLQVNYSVLKDPSGDYQYFTIDSKSGVISTQVSFDREKRGSYLIEVQSQDSSESARPGIYGQPNTGNILVVKIFHEPTTLDVSSTNALRFLHGQKE